MAEIFITQLKKIQQTERDAEKFLSITEAELEAAYSKMEGFLKSLFVGQENVTLQDVVRVSQKIEDVAVQINKEKNLAEIVVYNNAVAPYQGEVQRVLQKFVTDLSGGFSQDFKTKVTPQKVVEAIGAVVRGGMENSEDQMLAQMVKVLTPIMARDAKGLVARNHSYLLTNKDIGAYMDVVRQRVQGLIRTAADVSTNKEEVQAQKDILMEMLKSGARL